MFHRPLTRAAPKARNIIARGKREARRPWLNTQKKDQGLKGRNSRNRITPFQGSRLLFNLFPGATCSASLRTCPWLSYSAPSALNGCNDWTMFRIIVGTDLEWWSFHDSATQFRAATHATDATTAELARRSG